MLSNDLIKAKTIDDLLEDARMQIPLYSHEWTNYNPSDPAITILEGISYATITQQSFIDIMPPAVQEKLFNLAGCVRQQGRSARVLLSAENVTEGLTIPAGQKFTVGNMIFETNRENHLIKSSIIGIYSICNRTCNDYSYVLDPDIPIKANVFGSTPTVGSELCFVCDNLDDPGEDLIFYIEMDEKIRRNAMNENQIFSEVQWQCYTAKGFVDLKVKDYTDGLMHSGEVRIKLPKQGAEIYSRLPQKGYCIRAVLKKAEFDITPSIQRISGFLFEVWQKDTQSICYTFPNKDMISVYSDILDFGYWMMFVKEEDGYYHKYERYPEYEELNGRYYRIENTGFGSYNIYFDKETFGYGPGEYINAIKLVAYNEDIMNRYRLGTVLGYENQRMELPVNNILQENFSIIAERELENGEKIYDFVKPESDIEYDLVYSFDETTNSLKIIDAGDFIGAELYMSACATTEGEMGNIREGAQFIPKGYFTDIKFTNPAQGSGGRLRDNLSDIKRRFIKEVNNHYTAVNAADYERIVRETPGLCIHKVKTVMNSEKNEVTIAVKPYGNTERPVLSPIYRDIIMKNIENRRLLATRIALIDPVYVEVVCTGTIFVKPHYEGSREQIETIIRQHLDYVNSDRNFGELMSFDELFHGIESLECVELIYDLSCTSKNGQLAPKQGLDILPKSNCLLVPGEIRIELNTLD